MSLPRYAAQRDANEADIVKALERVGALVERRTKPDLLVLFRDRYYLMEVDNPANPYRKRDDAQLKFLRAWRIPLVQTDQDALRVIGVI